MKGGIVRAGRILTEAASPLHWHELRGAALYHEGGVIRELGPYEEIRQRYPGVSEVGSDHLVAIPGLVNGHHHVGLTPFQLGAPDMPNEWWGTARMACRSVDPYLDTLYSCFELLSSGVTTVQHIRGLHFGTRQQLLQDSDAILSAYIDVGMRVSYCTNARDQGRLVMGSDEEFLASLPSDLRPSVRWYLDGISLSLDDYFDVFFQLRQRYSHSTRVRIQLAPANLHWLSDHALQRFATTALEEGALLHMHLLETPYQRAYACRRHPNGAVARLADVGLLGPHVTLGHAVWLDDVEIARIGSTGTRICVNCSSNFRLRNGIAPVRRFLDAQIPVGIGIDEAGLNDDHDMLQEMRVVLKTQRLPPNDSNTLTASEVLSMGTAGSAGSTPYAGRIGRLQPGQEADIVLLDWPGISSPFLDPAVPTVEAIVHRAKSGHVRAVMVGGELVYEDGRLLRIDHLGAIEELRRRMQRPPSSDECRRRETSSRLMPHVKKYYENYVDWDAIRNPRALPNSAG